jgi:hypothetical protein
MEERMAKKTATAKKANKKRGKKAGTKSSYAKKKTSLRSGSKRTSKKSVAQVPLIQVKGSAPADTSPVVSKLPEIAFYYPNPYWRNVDWAKNLILFFDGIGMLIPNYMPDVSRLEDEAVIAGLKEHNLFHVFQPEIFLDKDSAVRLGNAMTEIVSSGVLDDLKEEADGNFAELSMSRMGYHVAEEYAKDIFKQLKKRGLAKESRDGVSIPMHRDVRYIILILLSQILRSNGRKAGFELLPATDVPQLVGALSELLAKPRMPSAEHVISLDIQAVGVDVSSIPIDEILSFRQENKEAYGHYARSLRLCIHDLGLMPPEDQQAMLDERQEEIASLASDLRKTSKKAWKKPATFVLSAAGAVWRLYQGDVIGASIAGGAALLSLEKGATVDTGAYSYLFSARNRFW